MSTMNFYTTFLNNLDPKFYEPLFNTTWGRDITLRTGITFANESTSFIRTNFGAIGSQSATGKPWVNQDSSTIPGVSVDGEHVVTPLRLLARQLSYTSVELERGAKLNMPVDVQKFNALNKMYQMSTDEMVYIGDDGVGAKGLVNSTLVTIENEVNGAGGSPLWTAKTPDEILASVNSAINSAWAASAYSICPNKILLPPDRFAYIASQKVSNAGNVSILQFLEDNSISLRVNGRKLDIQPLKWLTGRGVGGVNRMVVYTNDEDKVRFPMVPVRRETPYFQGIAYHAPYIWAYGEVEFVYPETVLYRDGI